MIGGSAQIILKVPNHGFIIKILQSVFYDYDYRNISAAAWQIFNDVRLRLKTNQ
jgi:hypothetical protein